MKKLLLASTALVASAGFAYAEVTLGGDGYFGVAYNSEPGEDSLFTTTADPDFDEDGEAEFDTTEYVFIYDLDFDFTGSGTTDTGLTFGAEADADEIDTSQGIIGFDSEIFVSGDFGTLSMGDIDGGAENVVGDLAGVGVSGLGDFNEFIFLLGADAAPVGPIARYDFTFEGLTLSLGLSDDQGYSVGAGYATDLFSVGLAFESIAEGAVIEAFDTGDFFGADVNFSPASDEVQHIIGQGTVNFNNVSVKAIFGRATSEDADGEDFDIDQFGISADAVFDAITVSAYYRRLETESDNSDLDTENNFFGIGAAYDLGGGLAIEAGIVNIDLDSDAGFEDDNVTIADLGLSFSF